MIYSYFLKLKHYISISFLILYIMFLLPIQCSISKQEQNSPMNMPLGMLPMPKEEDIEKALQEIEKMSPEEWADLEKWCQEYIEQTKQAGIPLFQEEPPPLPQEQQPIEIKPIEQIEQKPIIEIKKLSTHDKSIFKILLKDLLNTINSIRSKASSDELLIVQISPIDSVLNALVYYFNILDHDIHANHFGEKEYENVYKNLQILYKEIKTIDAELEIQPTITILEYNAEERRAKSKKFKQTEKQLSDFINVIIDNVEKKSLINDLEKIIALYEPEALKVKLEQDAKEKNSQKFLQTLPSTSRDSRSFVEVKHTKQDQYKNNASASSNSYQTPFGGYDAGQNFYQDYSSLDNMYPSYNSSSFGEPSIKSINTNKSQINKQRLSQQIPDDTTTEKNNIDEKSTKKIVTADDIFNYIKNDLRTVSTNIKRCKDDIEQLITNLKQGALITKLDKKQVNFIEDEVIPEIKRAIRHIKELEAKTDSDRKIWRQYKDALDKFYQSSEFDVIRKIFNDIENQTPGAKDITKDLKESIQKFTKEIK